MSGYNGWNSLHHNESGTTKLEGDGVTVRVEYNREELILLVRDVHADPGNKHVVIRLARNETHLISAGIGATQREAGDHALEAQALDRAMENTTE